jgi:hypothetical protein
VPDLRLVKPTDPIEPGMDRMQINLAEVEQRIGIAQSHPFESQRAQARDLLVRDAELLVGLVRMFAAQLTLANKMLENGQSAGTILSLILHQQGELRWTKAEVEAYQPVPGTGWALEEDGDEWVLHTTVVASDSVESADQQTEGDK